MAPDPGNSLIPSNINVELSGDMLCFGTQEDVHAYVEFLDYLMDNWDYTNSDIYDDTDDEVNYLGDEATQLDIFKKPGIRADLFFIIIL